MSYHNTSSHAYLHTGAKCLVIVYHINVKITLKKHHNGMFDHFMMHTCGACSHDVNFCILDQVYLKTNEAALSFAFFSNFSSSPIPQKLCLRML